VCGFAGARADEPVLLRYKAAKGQTQFYKNRSEMKQNQSFAGMKLDNSMNQEAILTRVVDDVSSDGVATYKLKADRRKVEADFGFIGKFSFDSKSSERDTSGPLGASLIPILERTTGSEYQVLVSPRGEVKEVKGYAELFGDLIKDNPLAQQFGAWDNKGASVTEQEAFVVMSDKPVNPGDRWEIPFELELAPLGTMKGKTTCVYEGADKVGDRKTVRLGVTTDMTFHLKLEQPDSKVNGTLTTSNSSGTVQFDPEAGLVVKSKRSYSMSGQLTAEAGGMTIPIDTQQEQINELELLDKLPE
jgi:hypothetical protein